MPDLDTAEARRLLAEATEGPWWLDANDTIRGREDRGGRYPDIARMSAALPADWQLIIWLRNNAAALLDAYDAGRELAEAVEDAMGWAADRADPVILAALARWRDATRVC